MRVQITPSTRQLPAEVREAPEALTALVAFDSPRIPPGATLRDERSSAAIFPLEDRAVITEIPPGGREPVHWRAMFNVIALVLCVLSSLFLIVLILLHSGKGSGLSDMFGGTSSLSGGTALERRLDKITVVTALIFGASTFWLSWKWGG
jgi:preprotein translocase subunit SecG